MDNLFSSTVPLGLRGLSFTNPGQKVILWMRISYRETEGARRWSDHRKGKAWVSCPKLKRLVYDKM